MAKASFSPLGQWRGKSGGQVYRVRGGVQVVSNYQPSVTNPRTDAQLAQRAKFNLMTGMNRITPIKVLRGYAGTPAQKRAAFAKDLAKYITAQYVAPSGDEVTGKYVGTIDPHNIHFDKLVESFFSAGSSDISITDLNQQIGVGVSVGWTGSEFELSVDGMKLRFIDVHGPAGSPIDVMYVDSDEDPLNGGNVTFLGAGRHRIYAQLLVPTETLRSVAGTAPVNEQQTNINIVSDLTSGATTNYTIGHCIYIGSHVVAEPQP